MFMQDAGSLEKSKCLGPRNRMIWLVLVDFWEGDLQDEHKQSVKGGKSV